MNYIFDKIYDATLCKMFKRKAPCYKCDNGVQVAWIYRQWPDNNWTDDHHKNFNNELDADNFMDYLMTLKKRESGF